MMQAVYFVIIALVMFIGGANAAGAQEAITKADLDALEALIAAQQTNSNHIWTMVAAALVFFMQVGFLLIEGGSVRSKNSINVAQKNVVDLLVSVGVFYLIGYGLMFGPSMGGWFGSPGEAAFNEQEPWNFTFFVFQAAFVGTAATIVSGAVAERMKFVGYLVMTIAVALIIYPIFGHWAWGNLLHGDNTAWLADLGFIDFAGSTVVHSVGAWIALAAIIIIGPRIGKFNADGSANQLQGYSPVMAGAGAVILLIGWIGFNGGSTTAGTPDFAIIIANTVVAAIFGGCVALTIGRVLDGLFKPMRSINGMLGGLVAITAGCAVVTPHGALMIGAIAGAAVILSEELLEKAGKLDDVVGAISVHGTCGVLGTLLLAFFMTSDQLLAGSRFDQFLVQLQGVVIAFVWTFGVSMVLLKAADMIWGLRVSEEDQLLGLNVAEHGAQLGTGEIQRKLIEMTSGDKMDLTNRFDERSGDEAAEIAQIINPFVDRVHQLVSQLQAHATVVGSRSDKLYKMASGFTVTAERVHGEAGKTSEAAGSVDERLAENSKIVTQMNHEGARIAEAAEEMAHEMSTISSAVEELSASVGEIAANVNSASSVAEQADDLAAQSVETVGALQGAAEQIRGMVDLITAIADKTNLLALNATIEASRAGDAGRGFAVVAQEVKDLSHQTAKAVEEIQARVERLQSDSGSMAGNIESVTDIIRTMSQAVLEIQTVADAQSIATNQIASGMAQVSTHAGQMTGRITSLSDGLSQVATNTEELVEFSNSVAHSAQDMRTTASTTKNDAQTVNSDAEELSGVATKLKTAVSKFAV